MMLFTGGVFEHHLEDGTEFGVGQSKAIIRLYAHLPAAQLVCKIFEHLRLFNPNFHDDATIVCVKRLESSGMRGPL